MTTDNNPINNDATKMGNFLYEVISLAMREARPINYIEVLEIASKQELMSEDEFHCLVLYTLEKQFPQEEKVKTNVVELNNQLLEPKKEELKEQAFINIATVKSSFVKKLVTNISFESIGWEFNIKPEYFLNIIDIDEFRFARKQAEDAQKSAEVALEKAEQSLTWTINGFICSGIFSLVSILLSIIPMCSKETPKTVIIESKQVDSLSQFIDQNLKINQKMNEQLVKKIDSSLLKSVPKTQKGK